MGSFPFPLLERFWDRLGKLNRSGYYELDVFANGCWNGVILADKTKRAVGIRIWGHVDRNYTLPFPPDAIKDLRPAGLKNRIVARLPEVPVVLAPYVLLLLVSPILLRQGWNRLSLLCCVIGVLPVVAMGRSNFCLTGLMLLLAAVVLGALNLRKIFF